MNLTRTSPGRARDLLALALAATVGSACGTGQAPDGEDRTSKLTTYHTTNAVGAVVLKDRAGNPIAVGSTVPYSPEATCGGSCHNVAKITEGYHFQQGYGTSNANRIVSDTFNPAKPWLLSDGMYGKW
ncbi:MAG TPA: hypothetical protein VLS93_16520 [Anaeromyxobacteraceae bacterium]|nr:hypothetical protein [Anaeromyxobacteraceae bacterium]